jgi:hypothetical protein
MHEALLRIYSNIVIESNHQEHDPGAIEKVIAMDQRAAIIIEHGCKHQSTAESFLATCRSGTNVVLTWRRVSKAGPEWSLLLHMRCHCRFGGDWAAFTCERMEASQIIKSSMSLTISVVRF